MSSPAQVGVPPRWSLDAPKVHRVVLVHRPTARRTAIGAPERVAIAIAPTLDRLLVQLPSRAVTEWRRDRKLERCVAGIAGDLTAPNGAHVYAQGYYMPLGAVGPIEGFDPNGYSPIYPAIIRALVDERRGGR